MSGDISTLKKQLIGIARNEQDFLNYAKKTNSIGYEKLVAVCDKHGSSIIYRWKENELILEVIVCEGCWLSALEYDRLPDMSDENISRVKKLFHI